MTDKKASTVKRFQDGSIDYEYYVARGSIARHRELKITANKLQRIAQMQAHAFPALFTVALLLLVF